MKINDQDVRRYKGKQLKVTFAPPSDGVPYEWPDGFLLPIQQDITQKFGTCKVEMCFHGANRNEITRSISALLGLMAGPVRVTLDGYKGSYYGLLQKANPEKTISARYYMLELEFSGYMTDTDVFMEYTNQTGATIHRVGSRRMPCTVILTPTKDTAQFTLAGFGKHQIVVKNLQAGHKVTIDGARGLVTQDEKNKMADVEMWSFPGMDEPEKTLTWAPADVTVGVLYTPAWL